MRMKTIQYIILIFFISFLFSCDEESSDGNSSLASTASSNYIDIQQITPDSDDIEFNEYVDLTIKVNYRLETLDEAVLNIGFNSSSYNAYDIIDEKKVMVEAGVGEHTFYVTVYVVQYDSALYPFKVYVELYEPTSFRVLWYDTGEVKYL